jgi:hypothetical protein
MCLSHLLPCVCVDHLHLGQVPGRPQTAVVMTDAQGVEGPHVWGLKEKGVGLQQAVCICKLQARRVDSQPCPLPELHEFVNVS